MKELLITAVQISVCSGLFYAYYHFWLRDKRFHQYNRFYLLASTLFSIVLPFLNIPLHFTAAEKTESFTYRLLSVTQSDSVEAGTADLPIHSTGSHIPWSIIIIMLYWIPAVWLLIRMLLSLLRIWQQGRQYSGKPFGDLIFFNTVEPETPYVFFRWLFWNKELDLETEKAQKIFRHEYFHIRQFHSLDVILLELVSIFGWFNPVFFLIKKELSTIHEFLADEYALGYSDRYEYAELLIMQAIRSRQRMVQPFFSNNLKRRIAMITLQSTPQRRYLRKVLVLPLAAMLFGLLAFKVGTNVRQPPILREEPFTVVIDAGHGKQASGAYSGARVAGISEDELVLQLSQKIQELNNDPKLKIVLTRGDERTMDLKDRTAVVAREKAELFLSLHINYAIDKAQSPSGWEVNISRKKTGAFDRANQFWASILYENLKDVVNIAEQAKKQQTGIWVLDQSPCPAALLECGYLSSDKDRSFIQKEENQAIVAERILQAIISYANQYHREEAGTETDHPADVANGHLR